MKFIEMAMGHVGSAAAMAKLTGVTPQAVGKWVKQGYIPAGKCLAVYRACSKKISIIGLLEEAEDGERNRNNPDSQ